MIYKVFKFIINFIDHCDKLLEKVNEDKMVEKIENEILEYGVI